jgi:phosphoribosylformylglycinamidine cyclo-ligase
VFRWLQEVGKISQPDMLRIFNCGIGMICIIDAKDVIKAKQIFKSHKLKSFEIGSIKKSTVSSQIQYI